MQEEKGSEKIIDLGDVFRMLKLKRKTFYKVWAITFVLSCIWVLPKPRFFTCEVKLAPELMSSLSSRSSLSSLASSLMGVNLGSMTSTDAIYPMLYPELMKSPEFVVGLFDVTVSTYDGSIETNYYTYLKEHQKKNWLTTPINECIGWVTGLFSREEDFEEDDSQEHSIDPFDMNKGDYQIVESVISNIKCVVDKKTNVVTITMKDQDKRVCALMADSVKAHLQDFIFKYRTQKVRQDEAHYKHLTDSARLEYENALMNYSLYRDSHKYVKEYSVSEEGERLKKDLDIKYTAYNAFNTQYTAAVAKVQEATPSFTTLKSASIPHRASGPKRKMFVIAMLLLSTLITVLWQAKNILLK